MADAIWKIFQGITDQYPDMLPDEIVLPFRDPVAMEALHAFADLTEGDDLVVAIMKRLDAMAEEYVESDERSSGPQPIHRGDT